MTILENGHNLGSDYHSIDETFSICSNDGYEDMMLKKSQDESS